MAPVVAAAPQVLVDESTRLANSTVARIVKASKGGSLSDPTIKKQCVEKLQKINGELKGRIADADALAAHEAMKSGITGALGCDHTKLISVLCTRTKAALQRTRQAYRKAYDKDLAKEVASETSGVLGSNYGKMMSYALDGPDEYVADLIHAACHGMGCDEGALIELCLTRSPEQLAAGKKCWEGRKDKALFDYLGKELPDITYKNLKYLLLEILKGKKQWDAPVDEARAATNADIIKQEGRGMFSSMDVNKVADCLLAGPPSETRLLAELYEKKHGKSLKAKLEKKGPKVWAKAATALLVTPEEFVAMRLEGAMKGFGTNEKKLVRLLGGLDHSSRPSMPAVLQAYEKKYGRTLRDALRSEISGNFLKASLAWISALEDPAQANEALTTKKFDEVEDTDELLDALLMENESLGGMMASLDARAIYEACHGFGTSDSKLIKIVSARSKPHLQKVAAAYYEQRDKPMLHRLRKETSGWYKKLLTYLVESPEDADVRALDSAMDGLGADGMAIVDFLVGHSQARVRAAKAKWEGKHDKSLVDRIRSELHGSNKTLALQLLKGERDEQGAPNPTLAQQQAETLHKAARGMGTDEDSFILVLAKNSPAQNVATRTAYENKYGRSLDNLITKEMSGNLAKCLQALLLPPADYYAMRLRKAFVGLGTSDKVVVRVLGGHDKADILAIAAAYQRKYTSHLKDSIKKECSGNYKRLAMAWVSVPDALADPDAPIEIPEETSEKEEAPPPPEEEEPEPATPPAPPPPAYKPPPPPVPVYQPTAVAQPVAPPRPTTMTVPVPMGVYPGMTVVVQAPTGQRLAVIVPQGVGPGGVFAVPIPAPPPPQIRYY
jgi:hypothetical protein